MSEYIKTDDPRFVKDSHTSAIINIDRNGYNRFKLERDKAMQMQNLSHQVDSLQTEMQDIKRLLQQLLNGK